MDIQNTCANLLLPKTLIPICLATHRATVRPTWNEKISAMSWVESDLFLWMGLLITDTLHRYTWGNVSVKPHSQSYLYSGIMSKMLVWLFCNQLMWFIEADDPSALSRISTISTVKPLLLKPANKTTRDHTKCLKIELLCRPLYPFTSAKACCESPQNHGHKPWESNQTSP